MGTPQFAVPTLEHLVASGHQVMAVFTQPDRPKGRGQQLAFSPVKQAALERGLEVHQPQRIRRPEIVEQLRSMRSDAMVVVGYGQIIPQSIIDLPPLGIINVHASLLPKYRGAAPIQWAIANGESTTGVTTMRIDAGLDTGDMLLKAETGIGEDETAVELAARLAPMGAELLGETLRGLESGTIVAEKQDDSAATYAPILKKEDGLVDWTRPAQVIHNRARGFTPWPGAYTQFRGQVLHLAKTRVGTEAAQGEPGTIFDVRRRLFVSCGDGTSLELIDVQLEGRKKMDAGAFLNGQRLRPEEKLGEQLH
jgi:methionyl-tRNA formyltransferase